MNGYQYQVVISFRLDSRTRLDNQHAIAEHFRRLFGPTMILPAWTMADLDIAVRKIGAAGESSVDEGRWDASPSHQNGPVTPQTPSGGDQDALNRPRGLQ